MDGDTSKAPSKIDLLELDIDLRLSELWREVLDCEGELTLEFVAAVMRAAYGQGYTDALVEPERGKLCSDHGYRVPSHRR